MGPIHPVPTLLVRAPTTIQVEVATMMMTAARMKRLRVMWVSWMSLQHRKRLELYLLQKIPSQKLQRKLIVIYQVRSARIVKVIDVATNLANLKYFCIAPNATLLPILLVWV